MTFAARLPLPPSSNMMFATDFKTKRRFATKEYREWKRLAGATLFHQWQEAGRPQITKPYEVHIQVDINHQSDIVNREKAITDLLVSTIPDFPDDRWINRMLIERRRDMEASVIVRVDSVWEVAA
jgi:hypothetical protein